MPLGSLNIRVPYIETVGGPSGLRPEPCQGLSAPLGNETTQIQEKELAAEKETTQISDQYRGHLFGKIITLLSALALAQSHVVVVLREKEERHKVTKRSLRHKTK